MLPTLTHSPLQLYPLIRDSTVGVQRIIYEVASRAIAAKTSELVVEIATTMGSDSAASLPQIAENLMNVILTPSNGVDVRSYIIVAVP